MKDNKAIKLQAVYTKDAQVVSWVAVLLCVLWCVVLLCVISLWIVLLDLYVNSIMSQSMYAGKPSLLYLIFCISDK